MPLQLTDVPHHHDVRLSVNIFDHDAEVVEYRQSQREIRWQYPYSRGRAPKRGAVGVVRR